MPGDLKMTLTILDLPDIMEIIEECLSEVPSWQQEQLRARLQVIIDRAKSRCAT